MLVWRVGQRTYFLSNPLPGRVNKPMRCITLDTFNDLQDRRPAWQALAGDNPFRSWTWLEAWWRHYGDEAKTQRSLRLLAVVDDAHPERLLAALPAYIDRSLARGRVWRLCGDGEVCSDHLGLLVQDAAADDAVACLADAMIDRNDWDLLEFDGVDLCDEPTRALGRALQSRGASYSEIPAHNVWSVELPADWDEYLKQMSKSHRKQLRRLYRKTFDSGSTAWHLVESADQFDEAWRIFRDLHQRRRASLGQPGCFSSPTWAAFHEEVAEALLHEGRLSLSWLTIDDRPVAAEYQLQAGSATYAYQGGLDPDLLPLEPGRLSLMRCLQHAIADGTRTFSLLRGDEPYKLHWRAVSSATVQMQAAPSRTMAQWRHWAYQTAYQAGRMAKRLANLVG